MFSKSLINHETGLKEISDIILNESENMLAHTSDLPLDLSLRAGRLWYTYFSKGVSLTHGGVDESFINFESINNHPNLSTFNIYRSDRKSVFFTQEQMKKYLVEDGATSTITDLEKIAISFCLGSHEGVMRLARCIFQENINDGILLAMSSYGLLATAIATMEPIGYKTHFVSTDKLKGEKILLDDLENLVKMNPRAKTLLLELKTTAGAIYSEKEIRDIIRICKENNIYLIVDATHLHMNFSKENSFPDVVKLSQLMDFNEYASVITGSKTYGLERSRIGFIVLSTESRVCSWRTIDTDLYRVIGAGYDLPFEVANLLVNSTAADRKKFIARSLEKHRINLNIMIAYLEGVNSANIDQDLRPIVIREIPHEYHKGIKNIKLIYKPQGGITLKIDISDLKESYLTNIRMFNSEIFCYALNKLSGVVTLHSSCIMDPSGSTLRLSYSIKDDIHKGMQAMHQFCASLSPTIERNKFMPDVHCAEEYIRTSVEKYLLSKNRSAAINTRYTLFHTCPEINKIEAGTSAISSKNHRQLRAKL